LTPKENTIRRSGEDGGGGRVFMGSKRGEMRMLEWHAELITPYLKCELKRVIILSKI
jgi:hypothetical protein